MSWGNASHLYEGAIMRGRSGRTLVGAGLAGWKESAGQPMPEADGLNVGEVKAAVLVCRKQVRPS